MVCAGACFLIADAAQLVTAQNPGQDHAGQYAPADIAYGAQLYAAQCATCHGATGDGVGGVNLRSGSIRRASTDAELTRLIAAGIPGTGMPPFAFNAAEQAGLVAYLRNMNALDPGSVKLGDPARGRTILDGKGECLTCHAVNDRGSVVAPDLSEIGANRAPSALERHLLAPSDQMMPVNRPVRLVTKDGKTIRGRRLNEDTYTLQVMDAEGSLVSVAKADLREFQVLTTSPMPSYKNKLSAQELSDLIAYLLSLKGT
jgi:putative heme-binding domain-containing protein